jgi:hypothetical protein
MAAHVQNSCSSCVECGSHAPALTGRSHALLALCSKHGLWQQKRQHGWRTPKICLRAQISSVSQDAFSGAYSLHPVAYWLLNADY